MNIDLTITLDAKTGVVNVAGPIHDRLLCYGMMAEAKMIVAAYAAKAQQQPPIVRATEVPKPPVQ